MRAITICMLVALTVIGTTLWAQKPGEGSEARHGERTGPRKDNHQGIGKNQKVSAVVEGVGTLGISVRQIDPRVRDIGWAFQMGSESACDHVNLRVRPSRPD